MNKYLNTWVYTNYSARILREAEGTLRSFFVIPHEEPCNMFMISPDDVNIEQFNKYNDKCSVIRPDDWDRFGVFDVRNGAQLYSDGSLYSAIETWSADVNYRVLFGYNHFDNDVHGSVLLPCKMATSADISKLLNDVLERYDE